MQPHADLAGMGDNSRVEGLDRFRLKQNAAYGTRLGVNVNKIEFHKDPWMMQRIFDALDAIETARLGGLEAELDLVSFAEDVIERYKP